jgi:hypothetical protein
MEELSQTADQIRGPQPALRSPSDRGPRTAEISHI